MFAASNIHYDLSERDRVLCEGGIGAMHLLAWQVGLIRRIDAELHLLKRHLPYHESDHVLNIGHNILSGGTCLDDLELRRENEVYLGAQRMPDPSTEGDFYRLFAAADLVSLMDAINETRIRLDAKRPDHRPVRNRCAESDQFGRTAKTLYEYACFGARSRGRLLACRRAP